MPSPLLIMPVLPYSGKTFPSHLSPLPVKLSLPLQADLHTCSPGSPVSLPCPIMELPPHHTPRTCLPSVCLPVWPGSAGWPGLVISISQVLAHSRCLCVWFLYFYGYWRGRGGRGLTATGLCFTRTPQSHCNPRDNANPTEPTLDRFNQKGMYLRVLGGSWNLQTTREPVSERNSPKEHSKSSAWLLQWGALWLPRPGTRSPQLPFSVI